MLMNQLMNFPRIAALCMAIVWSAGVVASEDVVRKGFKTRFPDMKIEAVTKTPFPGIYEVVFDGQVVYTDEKLGWLMTGNLFDLRTPQERNLTRERRDQIATVALAKAQGNAIKRVRGNGRRVIYTFEDPNCGYCRDLQRELNKINDVTVYTFLLPILSADSNEKSRAVWCSKDRAKAWDELMSRTAQPAAAPRACTTPIEENQALAQRFGVRGTPAVYLANGQQIGGYVPADKIEQALSALR